jgi:hypothetical protein
MQITDPVTNKIFVRIRNPKAPIKGFSSAPDNLVDLSEMVSARQVAIDFGFDAFETKIVENGPIGWAFFNNLLKDKKKCPVLWQCIDEMNHIKKVFNNLVL